MAEIFKVTNFIDGKYVEPVGGSWLDNFDPTTGRVYSHVADSDEKDVQLAYEAAARAFPIWSKTPREQRAKILYKIADPIEARIDEFAAAESRDNGKPVALAKNMDINRVVANFRFFAGAILHHEDMSTQMDGVAVNYTVSQPVGVAGLISPWNLPLYLLSWKIAPAIACGNTCVCKPSEMTSVTAWMLGQVLNDAGLPAGVVNLVNGLGPKCGNAIVSHPSIPLISFTGGTATAKHIIIASAPYYKKMSLELGGKNPNIIFDDANLDTCVDVTVRSSFLNQGEICLCGSRLLVQEGIYPEFLKRFVAKTKALVVGDPKDPKTNMGALISKEHLAKVTSYVEMAKRDGGKIETGGGRPAGLPAEFEGGYFLEPTIITGLDHSSCVVTEEIFGPVVTITTFKTEEEAIELANSVKYGLSCTIWTENSGRVHRVGLGVHAGTVWVNTWLMRDLRVPFGGVKQSGIGREGGKHSIEFYTEQKTICVRYDGK
eukprot:TRINITY_DN2453_c0_g1_i3.p1 TRINITY_DN2453_c0_g1~~TRINITY_DN2453_c0_g1_i3.p1  ORF type:complete len:495 (+),score=95.46 TRINITY_DN2453_c0_g1_i3:24-1487(+)